MELAYSVLVGIEVLALIGAGLGALSIGRSYSSMETSDE